MNFEKELEELLNRHSQDNFAQTPDFLLAKYLKGCLDVYASAVREREAWFGRGPVPDSREAAP